MRITSRQLRQIIREELMREQDNGTLRFPATSDRGPGLMNPAQLLRDRKRDFDRELTIRQQEKSQEILERPPSVRDPELAEAIRNLVFETRFGVMNDQISVIISVRELYKLGIGYPDDGKLDMEILDIVEASCRDTYGNPSIEITKDAALKSIAAHHSYQKDLAGVKSPDPQEAFFDEAFSLRAVQTGVPAKEPGFMDKVTDFLSGD